MRDFRRECHERHPWPCSLTTEEFRALRKPEARLRGVYLKAAGGEADPIVEALSQILKPMNIHLYNENHRLEGILELCRMCRFAHAADFGVLNFTDGDPQVTWFAGMLSGLGKPYLALDRRATGESVREGHPYCPDRRYLLAYRGMRGLTRGLMMRLPPFLERVKAMDSYENSLRQFLQSRLQKVSYRHRQVLKLVLLLGRNPFDEQMLIEPLRSYGEFYLDAMLDDFAPELVRLGLIQADEVHEGASVKAIYRIPEHYLDGLREELFEDGAPQEMDVIEDEE